MLNLSCQQEGLIDVSSMHDMWPVAPALSELQSSGLGHHREVIQGPCVLEETSQVCKLARAFLMLLCIMVLTVC
jgi:hypothetical protein